MRKNNKNCGALTYWATRRQLKMSGEESQKLRSSFRHRQQTDKVVYIGPALEGGNLECVKVLSGKVDNRKPSFL